MRHASLLLAALTTFAVVSAGCATATRDFRDDAGGSGGEGGTGGTGGTGGAGGTGGTGGSGGAGPGCGDGIVQPPEQCDDGNTQSDDGCSSACQVELCGDGVVQQGLGEQCDDGNTQSDDGCSDTCQSEVCGDGVVQQGLGEQCDDGNIVAGDGCSDVCALEYCGDGVVQPVIGEQCDDGNAQSDDGCSSECQLEYCGDGIVQADEQCDDGNSNNNDACLNNCTLNASLACAGVGTGISLLANADFETGATTPWVYDSSYVPTSNSHSGLWAAEGNGNHYLEQTFSAVPVAQIARATFWTWHDPSDSAIMAVEWGYSDGTTGSTFIGSGLSGWVEINVQPNLTQGKSLNRIRVWGYSGGGPAADISRFDDFRFCR